MLLHLVSMSIAALLVAATLPLVLELLVLSAAALPRAKTPPSGGDAVTCSLAVVVPAHNEEAGIAACVQSLRGSRRAPEAIFVVAHNCTDATAAQAAASGAEPLELRDEGAHGKGAALLFGMRHALAQGHTAVLVVDADSVVEPLLTGTVAAAMAAGADAVQARYLAGNAGATTRTRIMALSLTGINVLRPLGRSRLGLSCGIFGNGFAVSAATLRAVPYTAYSIVEDLEYHLALVSSGRSVRFLNSATVLGELPDNDRAAGTQRARWEGGRAQMRRKFVPRLAGKVLRGRLRLLEPLLDLLSLPLASVVPLLLVLLVLPLQWSRVYALAGFAALALYVAAAVRLSEEPQSAVRAIAAVPGYLLFKLGLVRAKQHAARGRATWVRTARNTPGAAADNTVDHAAPPQPSPSAATGDPL